MEEVLAGWRSLGHVGFAHRIGSVITGRACGEGHGLRARDDSRTGCRG